MNRQRALFAIHVAAVLFGLTGIFGELIQADALVITAGRASFAVLALLAFIRYQGGSLMQGFRLRNIGVLAAAGAMLALHWVTFFISVKIAGVAVATLGFASFPAFITLCECVFFKEKVRMAEWLILGLVTLGLMLVTPSFDFRDEATVGLAWAILSGLSFAIFTLINRRAAAHIPAQQVACWENLVVALLTLPFSFPAIAQLDAINWLWIALLGVFCTALSHYLLVSSLMTLKARSAGIVIALEPLYAIFFAAILFAQYPSNRALFGGSLMIGAIVWSGLRKTGTHAGKSVP
ncbi:EamA family transporter [Pollutimonas nitritireducens]|uniref:EamA family transporter n=1 Tax=Pollutimonas nitritireducens TaxID=2045209 RepID=A0A2N4UJ41_9BURK|nr:DMT family transporter [Pollutimonas nitritireducens]PLC55044.1 EamA family transporter [Pollutimonas nitritireducens]